MKKSWKKILLFISTIGPGLFLVGYNIGTGSVTTMASAGAAHGMGLTWAVLLSVIFTYFLIIIFGKFTLVTGDTALHSYKKHFGKGYAGFVLVTLIFTEMISSMGVMAVVVEVVNEWSKPLTPSGEGFDMIVVTIFFAVILVYFLFSGHYRKIENILAFFVAIMGLSFILSAFMVIPDAAMVISGLVPNIPGGENGGLIVAGMIGTTMGGVLFIVRSATIKQKDWSLKDLKTEKRDAIISVSLMFFLSLAIMAAAAGTLKPLGLTVENAVDMVKSLEPIAGRFAISIFVTGIVAAGLSSLFPHYILVPLLLSDYKQEKFTLNSWRNRGIIIFYASLGLVIPIFGGRPVLVLIIAQALTLVATPLVLILMMILINREGLMGKYKANLFTNILMVLVTLFTAAMAMVGIVGIIESF